MAKDKNMKNIDAAVEKYRDLILKAERDIWATPETGYREVKTSAYMENIFRELGYELKLAGDIPGFITEIDTGREGPTVLVLGELDSLICGTHPECDKETGYVHSCGHHAQCAALIGVAAALRDDKVLADLSGKIRLCAVPAEELLEIEYRTELKKKGIIKYFGGKSEFLHRGYFDGVDIALMVHSTVAKNFAIRRGSIGCMSKRIIYKGKASHAGGAPQNGINALYAANCGINAVNAIRETLVEADKVRIHPIITSGGEAVNAIPETVTLESYVRGLTFDAITSANAKMNRALIGGALSLGANIEIIDTPGYGPLVNSTDMMYVAKEAAELILPDEEIDFSLDKVGTGCTDMGDLSQIMPVIHPYAPGAVGTSHGNNYYIVDPVRACVKSAKWQCAMLKLLLENGAERAKQIKRDFVPSFESKEAFLKFQDTLCCEGNRIEYAEDGAVSVKLG